ncbi:hypothetical protein [Parapedobacter sp. SGR-10]|uniref:hypothetical protein n=1 Tax=Parapedobacter sp. SGR-10 TaxID=2710879 RepID=UPI001980E960|nr:hypothetical protein [Parapedobacter sp. SGR-10]
MLQAVGHDDSVKLGKKINAMLSFTHSNALFTHSNEALAHCLKKQKKVQVDLD